MLCKLLPDVTLLQLSVGETETLESIPVSHDEICQL